MWYGLRSCCLCAAMVALLPALAVAQADRELDEAIRAARHKMPGKLSLRLNPSAVAVRSDAPFSIDLELESTFDQILQGDLELKFRDDGAERLNLRTGPVVVPNGKRSIRVGLPSIAPVRDSWRDSSALTVRVTFHDEKRDIDLGTHDLPLPRGGQRQLLIGAPGLSETAIAGLVRRLHLDTFRPTKLTRSSFSTLPVEVDLQNIPSGPLGLYSYDVLVLYGEYFSRLADRQLETIGDWVEAGGGVFVAPTGTLSRAHVQFLRRLAGHDSDAPQFVLDSLGHLPPPKSGLANGLLACRNGFGRAIILRTDPHFERFGSPSGGEEAKWNRAVCFLWNVQPKQTQAIVHDKHWEMPMRKNVGSGLTLSTVKNQRSRTVEQFLNDTDALFDQGTLLHSIEFLKADALRRASFRRTSAWCRLGWSPRSSPSSCWRSRLAITWCWGCCATSSDLDRLSDVEPPVHGRHGRDRRSVQRFGRPPRCTGGRGHR